MSVMNSLRQLRRSGIRSSAKRFWCLSLLLLFPAVLSAQTVSVPPINSQVTKEFSPMYFDKYVVHSMDWGFVWLDTNALNAGFVGVLGYCAFPLNPVTGLYTVSDCNGVGTPGLSSDGKTLVINNLGSSCHTLAKGCGGTHVNGVYAFGFQVGSWTYVPSWNTQASSTSQTADLQGRTWSLSCTPSSSPPVNCTWTASGNPNAPPTNNGNATNTSAAGRADKTNYFGDQWTLKDTSASIHPITRVDWDYRYTTSFVADPPADTQGGQSHTFPFPCDPSAGGNISTGAGCWASVGSPTTTGTYQFALQATNDNGTGSPPFVSSAISVSAPQIFINGTTSASNPTLRILTGGTADATATQGSPVSYRWSFTPSGGGTTAIVSVPLGTTDYSLTVNYADGYSVSLAGRVVQTDLVPGFTLSPNPVLLSSTLTLTNKMQKSTAATLNSVDWQIGSGACDGRTSIPTGPLASSFLPVNGTAPVSGPATVGSYCMYLQYNFTNSSGQNQSLVASTPFSATNWAPSPLINISPLPLCLPDCQLTTGTSYSLNDSESILISPHPAAAWDLVTGTGTTHIGDNPDANVVVAWTPAAACNSGCNLKLTVGGVSATRAVTISNPGPPPQTNPAVSLFGPSSLSIGQNGTFTASVSNASGAVTYSWLFDDTPFPQSGGASMTHSWSSSGSHSLSITVTASNGSASASRTVSVTGNPAPGGGLTVTPVSQVSGTTFTVGRGQQTTFTATETNASQFGWIFGDGTMAGGPTARVVQKTYSNLGTYSGSLQVTGDGTHTTGLTTTTFTIVVGAPLPSAAFTIAGATQNPASGAYDTEIGRNLVLTASETNASGFSWNFGDGTTSVGRVVAKSYTSVSTVTVTLTVTGDGVNNGGTTSSTATLHVNPSTFHAAIVPGAAHLDDGTTTWGTDVSVTNAGSSTLTINLAFVPLLSDAYAPTSLDLTQLGYGSPVVLTPGGSYSVADVVTALGGGNNKGTLVIKYTGGSEAPLVSTRVYFQPKSNPGNVSYGSGLPAYEVDATGRISAQGFTSVALQGMTPVGAAGIEAVQDFALTVNLAGTGTGTVTSSPPGISCPTTCSATFPDGSSVFLSGSPSAGSTFDGVAGCDSYPVGTCAVSSAKTVTATFTATGGGGGGGGGGGSSYSLSISKSGSGSGTVTSSPAGINCGATCTNTFSSGTSVTLSASAAGGSTFAGWGGACSGSGSCVVTMSADQSVSATFNSSVSQPQGDQVLIGLVANPRYRFGVTLFNASSSSGTFQLSAMDENSAGLLISDGAGGQVGHRDFTIRPYQQVYLKNDDLGLTDPNQRYVLKATRTSSTGTLLAFGTALDRTTLDLVQVTDDSQESPADSTGIVSYWLAGVSKYDSSYGAHWRTDLRIYNRGSGARNLYFEYDFSGDGVTEHAAKVGPVPIGANALLTYDDVIGSLMSHDTSVDLSGSSAGILRVYYVGDSDSASRPLIIGSRNYDDEPTGTAGSQLAVYTGHQAAGLGQKLVLSGAEESARYGSRIGVFTLDPGPVTGVISAVAPDGTVVGTLPFSVGGNDPVDNHVLPHYGQINLTVLNGFANPNTPVSIRIDSISGGRLAAYAFTVDKVTLDTNFIQALPQQ